MFIYNLCVHHRESGLNTKRKKNESKMAANLPELYKNLNGDLGMTAEREEVVFCTEP